MNVLREVLTRSRGVLWGTSRKVRVGVALHGGVPRGRRSLSGHGSVVRFGHGGISVEESPIHGGRREVYEVPMNFTGADDRLTPGLWGPRCGPKRDEVGGRHRLPVLPGFFKARVK